MRCVNERCQYENEPGVRVCVRCGCLLAGIVLANRYRIDALLGIGGMGAVYRASDLQLERELALKALLPRHDNADELRQRFLREAKVAVRLEHANIVPVYHTDEDQGVAFLLMPLLRGGTLKDRMKGRPLPSGEALTYLRQLGSALDYAHTRPAPIIHRDVKPANILFSEGDQLMLSDFGIARLSGVAPDLTRPDVAPGTVQFMAPEQGKGHAAPASDQYSAAVILYALLTGHLPFDGSDGLAIAIQHATEPPLPPSKAHPGISVVVDAVVMRALAKRPEDRFPTMRAFVRALDMALRAPGGPVSTLTRPRGETFPTLPAVRFTLPTVRPTPAAADLAALRQQAKEARNAKQYEEAVSLYRQLAALDPSHAPTWFWLGWSLNALGSFGEALSALDSCLELDHHRARVWNTRGYALFMLERYKDSLVCCDRVLTLEPDNAAAWQNRGIVLQKLGQIEEALRTFERAAQLQPTSARFQRVADTLRTLGREEEARQWDARRDLLIEHPVRPRNP
ncbi:MAG TPA: serine/threonine-protein kinase [Ktedonobacterales bacterium]|jgi:serine/threonine protein kinase